MLSVPTSQTPKPDLSEHEDEAIPFDQVMKKLVEAKPTPKKSEPKKETPYANEKP